MKRGAVAAAAIVALALALATLALTGRPSAIRRPDRTARQVLLVPDFENATGRPELTPLVRRLAEAVRERIGGDPDSIFEISPRRLRLAGDAGERDRGVLSIASGLGADYVLVGSLETGPAGALGSGSAWPEPGPPASDGSAVRLDVLLVRDSDPPYVFAERFPLGRLAPDGGVAEPDRIAARIADRIALSLRAPGSPPAGR